MRRKLAVFSHAGVLGVNRAPFQWLAKESGAEVTLFVPREWKGDLIRELKFEPSVEDASLRVVSVPLFFSGNGSLFVLRRNLREFVESTRPDYVFVDEEPWSLAASQIYRQFKDFPKCVFTKQNLKKRLPFPFRQLELSIYRQSERIYAVSQEVEDVLRWRGFSGPISHLDHSYDPELFKPQKKNDLRPEFGIPTNAFVIGYIGRLSEEKGLADLIEALRRLPKKVQSEIFVWVVGNGPLDAFCRTQLAELSISHSQRPAIPHHQIGRAIALLDCLVLPSRTTPQWKEQFGRILVEAMACQVAVLGSDSGEIPHLIRRCGGGESFLERNPQDLADKLQSWFEQPSEVARFAQQGFSYVSKNLTHQVVAGRLAEELGFKASS